MCIRDRGIPLKTRHNEVAPNQFELAPIFEECNLANDHNLLVMALMRKISRKHGFRVLLHEKPFKGVNGSGKHNNWSLGTDTGIGLMGPGKTPEDTLLSLIHIFWVKAPKGLTSWKFFDKLLYAVNIVGTPGVGFGPSGEG